MNRYHEVKVIGEGNFGKVLLAQHLQTQEFVAIKILHKQHITNHESRTRIQSQIQVLKKLSHQYIIQLYEVIEEKHAIYLVMEYAESGDLFQMLKREKIVEEREACRMIAEVIIAVMHMHKNGIAHQDLKLSNIFLDDGLHVKLGDFGLSTKYAEKQKLRTSCGSPCFAAPEVIRGVPHDPLKADLWSIGVVFYSLLMGNLPFYHKNVYELYKQIFSGKYQHLKNCSDATKHFIQNLLLIKPEERMDVKELLQHNFIKKLMNEKQLKKQVQTDKKAKIVGIIFSMGKYRKQEIVTAFQLKTFDHLNALIEIFSKMEDQKLSKFYEKTLKSQENSSKQAFIQRSPFRQTIKNCRKEIQRKCQSRTSLLQKQNNNQSNREPHKQFPQTYIKLSSKTIEIKASMKQTQISLRMGYLFSNNDLSNCKSYR